MSNSECISVWKEQILSDIQNDEMILKVLGVTEDEIEDGLMYNRLFPFSYVYETQTVVKTYICIDISIDRTNDFRFRNELFVRPIITFRIIGHQDDMKVTTMQTFKTKLDYVAELIDKKYNGKRIKGSYELFLLKNQPLDISTTYRERVVQFRGVSLDKAVCDN